MEQYEEIIAKIKSGLTGDTKKDIDYLMEQGETYKDHPLAKEITREIGRIIFSLLPEEDKKDFFNAEAQDPFQANATLQAAKELINTGKTGEALSLLTNLTETLEEANLMAEDSVSRYFDFGETFEEILFMHSEDYKKEIRKCFVPMSQVYSLKGAVLIELKQFEQAKDALAMALLWNPVDFYTHMEYVEISRMKGDMDEFLEGTKTMFHVAIHAIQVARCLRNMGYYFSEKQLFREATTCYLMSIQYEDHPMAHQELTYIEQMTNGKDLQPTPDFGIKTAEKYGYSFGGDFQVALLAAMYGKDAKNRKMDDVAEYFFSIFTELTRMEDPTPIWEKMPKI